MRQLFNFNILDYTARETWDVCAGALSYSSSGHRVSIPLHFSSTAWSSFQQFTVVESSHGCLMWKVIHQLHTFATHEDCGHEFPSWRLSVKLPGWHWVGVLPPHRLLFGDKIPVMDSWFIARYSVKQNVVWSVDSQQFWTCFHPKWLLNRRQKMRSPSLQTLLKPTWSCEIQYAAAIWNTHFSDYLQDLTRRCSIISVSTAWQQLSVVTSTGRPAWWSSSINVHCSDTFKFSNPSGDGCIQWGTDPVNICQTFMKVVGRQFF